jgi:hypothetical protein
LYEFALKNISIKWGIGTYKLQKPNGSKEGIISWSQYGQDQLIDKLLNQKRNGFFVEIVGYDGGTCHLLNTGQHVTYDEHHIRYRVTYTGVFIK